MNGQPAEQHATAAIWRAQGRLVKGRQREGGKRKIEWHGLRCGCLARRELGALYTTTQLHGYASLTPLARANVESALAAVSTRS
eukprot:SAG11_NODE_1178_length_5598_cov_4.168394_3_plen_84_part_00